MTNIPEDHVYQLKEGTSHGMIGMQWFSCSCGAAGAVSQYPRAEWANHKTLALTFETLYGQVEEFVSKQGFKVEFHRHEIIIKKGAR